MQQLSTLDTSGPIDFDNLSIVIRPRPPERRQSGVSIIPFRPYVKRLTSVRQSFSFTNGRDQWVTTGDKEPFFYQENARCIGSLINDCGISDVIRWDIEGESTRLPMMCKLWMIVDGAVVERGKPRMVQDAAVQVYTGGRTLLSLLSAHYHEFNQTIVTRYDRRRRHSWHDVNQYHSVPYFQYTRFTQLCKIKASQCDFDNQQLRSQEEYLPFIEEETAEEHYLIHTERHKAEEIIHAQDLPQDRVQISMTTQTEHQLKTRSTSIDSAITLASSFNTEVNESTQDTVSIHSRDMATGTRDDMEYSHQSIGTGSDMEYSNQSVSTRDDADYTHHSIATGNDVEYFEQSVATHDDIGYSDRSVATSDDIKYAHQSSTTHDNIEYATQSVSTRDDVDFTHHSIATGNDTEYSNQSVATHDDIEYSNQSVSTRDHIEYANQSIATGDGIEYSNQSVSTRDDVDYTHQSIATGNDTEYSNQSVSTHDDIEYSHQSVGTRDDIEHANRSVATGNDIEYTNQSVSTRDDADYTHQSIATGSDTEPSNQSVATHDDIEYAHQSVSTRDHADYTHQSIATGNDIEYSNQSVATHDDIEYTNQSVSTRDDVEFTHHSIATGNDIEYSNRSVATHDDIEYANRSVSTRDHADDTHQSIATGSDTKYAHQSVSTRDDLEYSHQSVATGNDIEYANQSVSTRDDAEYTHQSIAIGNDVEYANQSVATYDDIKYSNQSVSTQDDIGYSHQSVATHDDIRFSNQSVSTRDDIAYLHQSVSTRDDVEYLNRSISTRDDIEYLNQSVATQDEVQYSTRSIATGNDYPDYWLQFSTNEVLSEYIIAQNEDKDSSFLSPRQHDQSIQTETEQDTDIELDKPRPPSSRSSRTPKSSSSVTISNHYQVLDQTDDENNKGNTLRSTSHRRRLESPGDLDSHFSDYQIETSSSRGSARSRRVTSSSKQSDTGYNSFVSPLNPQAYSTPDLDNTLVADANSTDETNRTEQTRDSGIASASSLESLCERYEKTLRERRRAIAVINDQLLDVGDVVQHYRERIRDPIPTQSNQAIQVSREIVSTPPIPKEERPSSPVSSTRSIRSRYRFVPSVSSEEIIQEYIPSPRIYLPAPMSSNSSRQYHPHMGYCDICLTDHSSGSAWIRYNEQRLERLQQRIDLMLELEDFEETQSSLSTLDSIRSSTAATTTQRIDNILMGTSRRRNQITYNSDRTVASHQYNYRLPYRSTSMVTSSPRLIPRKLTRSTSPASKRVRISTNHVLIPNQTRLREPLSSSNSVPRPILRRNNPSLPLRPTRSTETSLVLRNNMHRRNYMVEQLNIPRYYRLYNDVGFREVYDFSRVLDSCLNRTTSRNYSSLVQHFAFEQPYTTSMTSVA